MTLADTRKLLLLALGTFWALALPPNTPLLAQNGDIFQDQLIEGFEKTEAADHVSGWKGKGLHLTLSSLVEGGAGPKSRNCLHISARSNSKRLQLIPSQPIFLAGFVESLGLWIKNEGAPLELWVDIGDQDHYRENLFWAKTPPKGHWQRLTVKIPPFIKQRPLQPTARAGIWLHGLYFRPLTPGKRKPELRLCLDKITARIRDFQKSIAPGWDKGS